MKPYRPTEAADEAVIHPAAIREGSPPRVRHQDGSVGELLDDLNGNPPGPDADGRWCVPVRWTSGEREGTTAWVRTEDVEIEGAK